MKTMFLSRTKTIKEKIYLLPFLAVYFKKYSFAIHLGWLIFEASLLWWNTDEADTLEE
jgi:hypothetical protein